MSQRKSDIFKSAQFSDGSADDDDGEYGTTNAASSRSGGSGVKFTDRASRHQTADPELTRALLNETTRRYDRKTMGILEKTLEVLPSVIIFVYLWDRNIDQRGGLRISLTGRMSCRATVCLTSPPRTHWIV